MAVHAFPSTNFSLMTLSGWPAFIAFFCTVSSIMALHGRFDPPTMTHLVYAYNHHTLSVLDNTVVVCNQYIATVIRIRWAILHIMRAHK